MRMAIKSVLVTILAAAAGILAVSLLTRSGLLGQKAGLLIISILALAVMMLTVIALFFVYRNIIRPIGEITRAIEMISMNNLNEIKGIDSDDEMGKLAKSVNHMIYGLRFFYNILEEKVREKTCDLDNKVKELEDRNRDMEEAQKATINILEDSRELESKIQEERDRSEAIIQSMGEGLYVVDQKHSVIMMNATAEKLFGIHIDSSQKLDIRNVYELLKKDKPVADKHRPEEYAMRHRLSRYWDLSENLFFRTRNGKIFPVIIITNPLVKEGEVIGAVVVFREVTEEKKLDDAKTNFISVASHQLRTPLTSMRWFTEMLLDNDMGKITDKQREFIGNIYQSIRRMIDLVNLLLQIARVEAGRLRVEPAPVKIEEFIREVAQSMDPLIQDKDQRIRIEAPGEGVPIIQLDKEMVWQVIQNLISNANRYGYENTEIVIRIKIEGPMVEISIANQGIGIPKENQEKIFQKFFRAENAIRKIPEGSGLGLSLVRSLVEGWGGSVWFESEPEKETIFHFNIPLEGMKKRAGEVGLKV